MQPTGCVYAVDHFLLGQNENKEFIHHDVLLEYYLRVDPVLRAVKKGCLSASAGLILLSGFSARQWSNKSMNWFSSRPSASFIPADAAVRRVRRSRVGLIMGKVLTFV
jgi:hypothetical protein